MRRGTDQVAKVSQRRRRSRDPVRESSVPNCNQASNRMTTPATSEHAAAIVPNVVDCRTSMSGGAGSEPLTGTQPTPTAPAPISAVPTSPGTTLRAKNAGRDSEGATGERAVVVTCPNDSVDTSRG
jgi:hypothetical protein